MNPESKPFCLTTLTLLLLLSFLFSFPPINTRSDVHYNTLVYQNCKPNPNSSNSITYSVSNSLESRAKTLSSLFEDLETQSSHANFFKTIAADEKSAVSGLFQCRGDLAGSTCRSCINALHETYNRLCQNAPSARIQLQGCYLKYETERLNVDDIIDDRMLFETSRIYKPVHKVCGEEAGEAVYGFKEMVDAALAAAESGVSEEGSKGYYESNYELVHVVAQCQGDVEGCDCGECVSNAAAAAAAECGSAVSAEVYLDGCYVGYTYYPHGIPHNIYDKGEGGNGNTAKSLAIVLGVAAVAVFAFVFLVFFKRLGRKDDDC